MARKRKRARPSGGNRQPKHAHQTRTETIISTIVDIDKYRTPLGPIGPDKLARDTHTRVINALGEMRRDLALTFTEAARRWHLDPRTIYRYAKSAFRKDNLGKVKARPNDRLRLTTQIPTTKPDIAADVHTKSFQDRSLVGQWFAAYNAAKTGDFSLIDQFPKGTFVGGVRLPTGHSEIQRMIEAEEKADTKFEGPYRVSARPL